MTDAQPSDDERAARLAAQRKAWNDAHPTYYAEYRERNREDIRRKNRERERDRAQREREEKARRQRGIDRARAWAAEHPEERQQARERYKQKYPEAYKQAQREYYYRNRDAIAERRRAREAADPEKASEARRRAVDRARAAGRDPAWSPTPDQRATYRERENEARRLQRRRARAGLPERRLHRVLAPERRHNEAAADAFFARKRSRGEVARIREQDLPTPPELVHALEQRSETRRVVRQIPGACRRDLAYALPRRAAPARCVYRAAPPRSRSSEHRLPPSQCHVSDLIARRLPVADVGSCEADTRHPALIPWPN
jgi:hypothetical protein